jgi:hypothetical protein
MNPDTSLTPDQRDAAIDRLLAHIIDNVPSVDPERLYCEMLDEVYSFESIGGPFAGMSPSRVLLECDPTAYHCGLSDYMDSRRDELVYIETGISGGYYNRRAVEKARDELVSEMDEELMEMRAGTKGGEEEEAAIAVLSAQIEAIRDYAF